MFKNKVQDIFDQNILSFTEEKSNVKANPLPNHGNQTLHAILKEDHTEVVSLVDDVKTVWSSISVSMQKHGVLAGIHDNYEVCKSESNRCENLKTMSKS